jgi:MFS-type transporter involved in bile tolerance (Atg22 family)
VAAIVATSVSPLVKSKVQVRGVTPLAVSAAWMKVSCAASSLWIVVSICVGIVGDAKPAATKSAGWNFARPCW